jgi:hypothetical protein
MRWPVRTHRATLSLCRDEKVRVRVNELLDWRGVPIRLGRGETHLITYADILRELEPFNEGRDERDRITYDSLWVHATRHYELAGIVTYWGARMVKELTSALERNGLKTYRGLTDG